MKNVYTTESEYDLGITDWIFATREVALKHARAGFAGSGLLDDFGSFEEYQESGLFNVYETWVISEEPKNG